MIIIDNLLLVHKNKYLFLMNKIFSYKKTQMKVVCIKIHKHSAHPNKIKIINHQREEEERISENS